METPGFPTCYPLKGGGNTFKLILRGQNYPNTNDRYNHNKKKKNYRSISLRNIETKIVNTINQQTKFNNILEQYIKKYNIHIIKGNIFQEHKDGSIPTNQLM